MAIPRSVPPLMIEMAIHYAVTAPEAGDFRNIDGAAQKEFAAILVNNGLLRPSGGERLYEPTEGLELWVKRICQAPMPVKIVGWQFPDGSTVFPKHGAADHG